MTVYRDALNPPSRITPPSRGDATPLPGSAINRFRAKGVCPYCYRSHGTKAEFTACRVDHTEGCR